MLNPTNRRLRTAAVGLAATALAGGASAFAATPAHAATVCNVDIVSVKAWDLNDGDGRDEIKLKLGDSPYWGPYHFWDGTYRSTSLGNLNKDFTSTVKLGLHEQDVARQTLDEYTIGCTILGERELLMEGKGAIYTVVVNTTVR
jgi:hypothetical protein